MNPGDLILEWLIWHQAVEYIKQDLLRVESAPLRFPFFPAGLLRMLGSRVYLMEREAAKELRINGIRIVKQKADRGELFVVWSHRGQVDILRIHEAKLRSEVQKKINVLASEIRNEQA